MWASRLPPPDEGLRQGDLLVDVPFPVRGAVRLTPEKLEAPVKPSAVMVVAHCCTVQQRRSLTLAKVISNAAMPDDHPFLKALRNVDPQIGDYAFYAHLLDPHPSIPVKNNKVRLVDLVDTVTLIGQSLDDFDWLRAKRVARMTTVSRAQLRQKLTVLTGRAEPDDREILAAEGLDSFGRPQPSKVRHGFGSE